MSDLLREKKIILIFTLPGPMRTNDKVIYGKPVILLMCIRIRIKILEVGSNWGERLPSNFDA